MPWLYSVLIVLTALLVALARYVITVRAQVKEAITDPLTGLGTGRYFMQELHREWRRSTCVGHQFSLAMTDFDGCKRASAPDGGLGGDKVMKALKATARPFSLIVMALDRFKPLVERMGRLEGDKVLRAAAALLSAWSEHSAVVARYEQNEFAILLPEARTEKARILAERLRAAVEADEFLRSYWITASMGIATFPDHEANPWMVFYRAKLQMHEAQHYNGNCVTVPRLGPAAGDAELAEVKRVGVDVLRRWSLSVRRAKTHPFLRMLESTKSPLLSMTFRGAQSIANRRYRRVQRKIVRRVAEILPPRDPKIKQPTARPSEAVGFSEAAGHSHVVSWLAALIANQAGLSQGKIEEIRQAGVVHDVGKIHVPRHVLHKAALLTAEEYEVMKTHAAWGEKMLEPLKRESSERIRRIVRHHHERYDGKGYPDHLKGEDIPVGARIVAVAECFHDMVTDHPYKDARTFEDAIAELHRCSGTQFDPVIVIAFLDWLELPDDPREQQ
jgi:diguanylate cyclase (GGDEF)-like protein